MGKSFSLSNKQQGSMLLEALISILIFSIGILAIVGLQANSIKLSGDAKYRSDASMVANGIIGDMWSDVSWAVSLAGSAPSFTPISFSGNELAPYLSPGGVKYQAWLARVQNTIPNSSLNIAISAPVVTPAPPGTAGAQQDFRAGVTITVLWTVPGEPQHNFTTSTLLTAQKQL